MAVLLSNKKVLELLELKGHVGVEKYLANDIFGNVEGATASLGVVQMEKGYVIDLNFTWDEFLYIVKGSVKIETESKATVAREGDIVHIQKGTVGTVSSDEGCEYISIVMPSRKMLGFLFKD